MHEDLESDFDIKCAKLLHCSASDLRKSASSDPGIIQDVRARLQQYLSLEAFMAGVHAASDPRPKRRGRDGRSRSCPLALLGQDDDTLHDFKARLVEFLGCPSRLEEATVLRNVSNKFTMNGY
jgi:hypothetical protein